MTTDPFLDWNGNVFGITDEALWVNIRNATGSPIPITSVGDGYISVGNTTEVNLAAGATFEGTFDNCLEYGGIRVSIYSSHASASRGLQFWCSKDGNNGFISDSYTVPAATAKTYASPVEAPYFKVRYTNGGTQTTTLKICTIFLKNMSVVSSHRIGDAVTDDDDAQLVAAVLKAQKPNQEYTNIDATAGGNLKVSMEEIESGVVIPTTRSDDFYNDAFQRLRVSNTDQRFDSEFILDKQPMVFEEIVGGAGTATHNANSRDVTLAIGGTALTNFAGLYQRWYNPYTPGNSQLIELTGTLNGANLAGTASVFLRSNVTGTVTEEVIPQSEWSMPSGINWQYSQIFIMDFQSLKVGRIRFGLDMDGLAVKMTEIKNDNRKAGGYWQLAAAPNYYRTYNLDGNTITEMGYGDTLNAIGIRYTTTANASQTMRAICSTVKSEGGGKLFEIEGFPFRTPPIATKTVSTTLIPLVSIQIQPTFNGLVNRSLVIPTTYSIQTDNPVDVVIVRNGTLTNASFTQVNANSVVFYDNSATAISGGRAVEGDLVSSGGTRAGATTSPITGKVPISVNYAGTTGDILTLCAVRSGGVNAATTAVLKWKEVR